MRYLLLVLMVISFIACRKEQDPYIGKMYAKLNNGFGLVRMDAIVENISIDSFLLNGTITENEIMKWHLRLNKVPKKVGRFEFPAWALSLPSISLTEWLSDGDLIGKIYYLPETKSTNYIEITSYNPETGDIEGRFEFTAYAGYYNGQNEITFDLQDSMSFTNGEFYTRIKP